MPKHISNIDQLATLMQPMMLKMVNEMAERVYETLNYFLNDYYVGWTPNCYRRTQDFLHSAVKVDAKPYKNGAKASVYIDYESMDEYVNATGYQVVEWANTGMHGGLQVNHKPHVWDETMKNTIDNGTLLNLAIAYLKSQGFSVRK